VSFFLLLDDNDNFFFLAGVGAGLRIALETLPRRNPAPRVPSCPLQEALHPALRYRVNMREEAHSASICVRPRSFAARTRLVGAKSACFSAIELHDWMSTPCPGSSLSSSRYHAEGGRGGAACRQGR
jgi:hypothetical protein